ncbi:MAG: IS30 family transposase [Peptoniphilus sp.]|uniref:IS30 family transposase n=1 Tax=Peptoniphilus sp. TaxID=1971214 RepID=UPI0025FEC551|nr:IS30 family transposase [Peptoniphilus sp.]MCI5643341.1 IS30 family transposase [Peptoniphilus sp.]
MSHKYLTLNERNKIEVLHKEGYSSRRISKILGFHHSTISRELKRYEDNYKAETANKDYKSKALLKGRKTKINNRLKKSIVEKLNSKWSPEQISATVLKGVVCFKTIYNWLYTGAIKFEISKLRRKGKSRKIKETRGRFNIGTSIRKRPKMIKKRLEFGHWELDTVVSSRGKSKGCLATFVEMKSRFYIALPMEDRSKDSMLEAVKKLIKALPKYALKSFTSDRGKEFACYKEIEDMGIEFYFADPYSAWQRGTNENSNGLLREYYPKKTDLAKIDIEELIKNIMELNNRPRKCLNYQTPFEIFMHELSLE